MVFFDLNIPVEDEATKNRKTNKDSKGKKVKLVVKAMELGYSGIAYNRVISGVIADADRCTTTPLPLSSLLQAAPSLAKSVRFHREVLGVPVGAPFRQYTRVTVVVESMVQAVVINPGNSVLRSYDLVAVRPMDQKTFEHACNHLEVDLISIDFSQKLPFHMKLPLIKAAIERGIFFEIMYSPAISNSHARRDTFATVKLLVDRTRGRNIIVSSAASKVNELRGPYDVANMSTLFGLSLEHAKAAVSKNCIGDAPQCASFKHRTPNSSQSSGHSDCHIRVLWPHPDVDLYLQESSTKLLYKLLSLQLCTLLQSMIKQH